MWHSAQMARSDPTVYMKIPPDLKAALDAASEENRRSLTAEVVARLQATFDGVQSPGELEKLRSDLEAERMRTEGGLYIAGLVAMNFQRLLDALPADSAALAKYRKDVPEWQELNEAIRRAALRASLSSTLSEPIDDDPETRSRVKDGIERMAQHGAVRLREVLSEHREAISSEAHQNQRSPRSRKKT